MNEPKLGHPQPSSIPARHASQPLLLHRRMLPAGKTCSFSSLSLLLLLLLSLLYFYFFAASTFGDKHLRMKATPAVAAKARLFELRSGDLAVKISNFGATITSLLVPDKNGDIADVVLGFDSLEPYLNGSSPYFGSIVGRVANRIRDGKFSIDGVKYSVSINDPPNSLHGGFRGFDKVLWDVVGHNTGSTPSITLKYHSEDGEQGYPGDVVVTATYSLPTSMSMKLEMEAIPWKKTTPINLAQHTYWNLAGHDSGTVHDHLVQIWATQCTPVDKQMIPTGQFNALRGTPYDFLTEHTVGSRIEQVHGGGYDLNYVLDRGELRSGLRLAAKVTNPLRSRSLKLWTDAPGVQFYTANYLNGITGKGGAVYQKHAGLCLETQGYPNAVNQFNFPSIIFRPGEKYKHTMLFEFSTE